MKYKQTAVEKLIDWMDKNQYFIGNDLLEAFELAKEIEKQQISEAYTIGVEEDVYSNPLRTGEKYYNDTFL
jgi:hypothetical protein